MESKYLAVFLLFAAFDSYVAPLLQRISYIQQSTKPLGQCVWLKYYPEDDNGIYERNWISDGKKQRDVKYLMNVVGNIYFFVDENGAQLGNTYQEVEKGDVFKIIIRDKVGDILKVSCITTKWQPTRGEQKTLAEFCNEKGMKIANNTNCAT